MSCKEIQLKYRELIIVFCLLMLGCDSGYAAKREISLRGTWKFELGDHAEWADPNLDDLDWADITVPGNWEDKNFPGYDGFAWYRKTVVIPKRLNADVLELHMGQKYLLQLMPLVLLHQHKLLP